jgi:hypothetical protein
MIAPTWLQRQDRCGEVDQDDIGYGYSLAEGNKNIKMRLRMAFRSNHEDKTPRTSSYFSSGMTLFVLG